MFSKLDLVKAFYQIPVAEDDVAKTAVITPFGLFEFLRMPFGLRNAAQTFQRFIDQITRDLEFAYVYIDDILVASKSEEEHKQHLRILFERLQMHGLTVNPAKCVFSTSSISFLGHEISPAGIKPLAGRVKGIVDFPKPTTDKMLRKFLGMINHYHRFIRNAAKTMAPLHALLKDKQIQWTEEAERAFEESKRMVAERTMLAFPAKTAFLSLAVDASDTAVGAVLQQRTKDNQPWTPLGFYSHGLDATQRKYSAFDRELLAIKLAIEHFRFMLEGRQFTVFTDHKPLTTAILSSTERTPRQFRHLDFIAQFTTDIRHVKGTENVVADALSRFNNVAAVEASTPIWSMQELADEQKKDDELKTLTSSAGLGPVELAPGVRIICDTTHARTRPFVPLTLRRRLFEAYHGTSHPAYKPTKKLITPKYFWPSMVSDLQSWCKTCPQCQPAKVTQHTKMPPQRIEMPKRRFSHIHIDLVGPLPSSNGCSYIFTVVDRFTRWPEAIPLPNIEAATVANALVDNWVSRFGVPDTITHDQGTQFESKLFASLARLIGSDRIRTSAYNPRANGMVERFHRQLKASLRAVEAGEKWSDHLPMVLLLFRNTYKEDLKASPADLVYGQSLTLPADLIGPSDPLDDTGLEAFARQLKQKMANVRTAESRPVHDCPEYVPADLLTCDYVYLRYDGVKTPLQRPYTGPYKVIRRSRQTVVIETNNGPTSVAIHRVKPAYVDEATMKVDMPKRRGRPRKNP